MEIRQIQDNVQRCSIETERIYTRLGTCFPTLLSITDSSGSSTLTALETLFRNLSEGFSGDRGDDAVFFESYNTKNASLFSDLNDKMSTLDRINERVSAIRADSEELEIISLNAMVISIKSGEKGRAFSCITENLKQLSARMISLSNELILDEKKLVEKNEALKTSFSTVLEAQKRVVDTRETGTSDDIVPVIREASNALDDMGKKAVFVKAPIQEAMSGIQLQDIIRQSIDQIILALGDLDISMTGTSEERLDQMTFDIELLSICLKITHDIIFNLDASIRTFSDNWKKVHGILDDVERIRLLFISTYLDALNRSGKSLPVLLEKMTGGFSEYISRIGLYQRGQRTMVRDSSMIVSEVKHLRTLFDTIRPIISRLQHVRITQQIEVAKNPAISAVKDTVEYMSDLIMKADVRVQETRKELEVFISDIEELTGNYSITVESDARELDGIKQEKTQFFNRMKTYQEELSSSIVNFRVYPDSFQSLCSETDALLADLEGTRKSMNVVHAEIETILEDLRSRRNALMAENGIGSWEIHNDRFKALVEQFTITSHKEAAGKIGGFDVDGTGLDSVESGDVTLFF